MNGPEALLHVVGGEKVGYASKLVKEVILKTEHRGRSDDGGLGVDGANDFLSPSLRLISFFVPLAGRRSTDLGREVLRGGILLRVVGGDVNESVDIVLGNSLNDALHTVNVDIGVREVPARLLVGSQLLRLCGPRTW